MKSELYQNGPISCGIHAYEAFEKEYKGGIWRSYIPNPELNHEIAVVGWGYDQTTEQEYWIARNSWGNYWGDYGFFKVPIGEPSINLGIQTDCSAGIPDFTPNSNSMAIKDKFEAENSMKGNFDFIQ